MKRIDSFFDKVPGDNPPKFKKQRKPNDAEKEDDANKSLQKQKILARRRVSPTRTPRKHVLNIFIPNGKQLFPGSITRKKTSGPTIQGLATR